LGVEESPPFFLRCIQPAQQFFCRFTFVFCGLSLFPTSFLSFSIHHSIFGSEFGAAFSFYSMDCVAHACFCVCLPYSICRRLQQVPENIWKFNENTFGEEKWWELNCLRKLILSSNQLHTFDYEAFKAAEAAELAAKPLSKPKRDQDPYDGRERPPFLELAYLDLSANHLVSLPDHVWHLTLLQHLNVSHNSFASLNIDPSSDNSHSGIQWLSLSDNKLSSIGDSSFRVLGNLTHLNLSNNTLASLPNDAFASLPKLRTLLLSHNKLSELPSLDSNWEAVSASLTELDIGHNLLKAVPNGFKNLTSLTKLDARQNRIADLDNADMSGCSRLTELMLYMNALKSVPKWFTSLKAINSVSFAENSISSLPANITTLVTLQRLDISTNDLSDVSAEVGKMTWLRSLNLDGNPLRGWKSSVISGSTEQILQYLFNRLPSGATSTSAKATGSSSSGSLGTTGSVYVPDNGIVALSKQRLSKLADDAFGTLSALKVKQLKLDQNNLTTLPGAVMETLVNLTLLDVSGNKTFNSLPSSISSCSALTSLSAYTSECSSCFGG
jgi:Leucine-rich repeat (LRR) protein